MKPMRSQRTRVPWLVAGIVTAFLLVNAQWNAAGAEAPPDRVPADVAALLDQTANGGTVRVIVQFEDMRSAAAAAEAVRAGGGEVIREYRNFAMLAVEVDEAGLRSLGEAQRVVSISEDAAEAPLLDTSLGDDLVGAFTVHDFGWDGAGTVVVVLDTGIDHEHPFFADRVIREACFSGGAGATLCPDGENEETGQGAANINVPACMDGTANICTHGLHVTGIAAGDGSTSDAFNAPRAGVAPGASIVAIQVFSRVADCSDDDEPPFPCVRSSVADQLAAHDYVIDLFDDDNLNIVAVNMSLGAGDFEEVCDDTDPERTAAFLALRIRNIAPITSSGNNNVNNAIGRPACISHAISVGATTNADVVTRNRGPLLDIFAPGQGITSARANDTFGPGSGTSMAAPHVAGAWAIIRQIYPAMTINQVLNLLQETGVPITYDSDSLDEDGVVIEVTTPRLDLLAALQPVLTVDVGTIEVDEGQVATNSGTYSDPNNDDVELSASVGTVVDNGDGTWDWSWQTVDGPADSQLVTITATDETDISGEVTFWLIVRNVAPTVQIDAAQVTTIDEGDTLTVLANFSDPGILDEPFTVRVVCYDVPGFFLEVDGTAEVTNVDADVPLLEGTATAECPYGDTSQSGDPPSGAFEVTVRVTDKDGGTGQTSVDVTVRNVDPTPVIDLTDALDVNGVPTFVAQIGEEIAFSGDITDPGSDDIFATWDWGDGNDVTTEYLNAALPDPFPSPNVSPRDITDVQAHTWLTACLFEVTFTAADDDGGEDSDRVDVIITGNADAARSPGYWLHQYRGRGQIDFDTKTLECYLAIVGHMSTVFHGENDASTFALATGVLHPGGNAGDMIRHLDRQLLAVWLNFANGAYRLDDMVDTTGNGVPDMTFWDAVAAAETVRLDPNATKAELEAQRDILERINLAHGG